MEIWKFLRIWAWPINGYARADNRCLPIIEDVLYTGRAEGLSFLICVATPDLFPCIVAAPSYACPLHILSGKAPRIRRSLITEPIVSAFAFGKC